MEINLTFVIQIFNILISLLFTKKFLVKPVLHVIKAKINNLKVIVSSGIDEKELSEKVAHKRAHDLKKFIKQSEPLLKGSTPGSPKISNKEVKEKLKEEGHSLEALPSQEVSEKTADSYAKKILDVICGS